MPMARWADRDLPVFRRLEPIVARWKADKTWTTPSCRPAQSAGSDETAINRIDLTTLGPLGLVAFPAEPFSRHRHRRQALVPGRATRAGTSW